MDQPQTRADALGSCVEVLTTAQGDVPFGYRVFGHRRGADLLVAGQGEAAQAVFDRLIANPALPWMHGNLVLVRTDLMGEPEQDQLGVGRSRETGHQLRLPEIAMGAFALRRHCTDILRACADLGKLPGAVQKEA
jgi:hypothetical protein